MTFRPPRSAGPGPAVTAGRGEAAECGVEMPAISQVVRKNLTVFSCHRGEATPEFKKHCLALTHTHQLLFTQR